MKQPLEIYINDTRVDTFNDESVTIKETIKDFRDAKKLFTGFSKTFSIPTSKTNNKVLEHAYRNDLTDVDPRLLMPAELKLNGVEYKVGNVSYEGTQFKDGKPYAYKIRFFGKLTELSKQIGAEELTDLDLTEHDISSPNFKTLFSSGSASDAVKFPLISRDYRYIWHSTDDDYAETEGFTRTKNIAYVYTARHEGYYGIVDNDLVGAIKVGSILDAIESKYGFSFTGAFADADYIRDLHLVLQNEGESPLNYGSTEPVSYFFDGFPSTHTASNTGGAMANYPSSMVILSNGRYGKVTPAAAYARTAIETVVTTSIPDFEVNLIKNGEVVATYTSSGTHEYDSDDVYSGDIFTWELKTNQTGSCSITASAVHTKKEEFLGGTLTVNTYSVSDSISAIAGGGSTYSISRNLPKMKVLDFLTSLFKRFNIVAEVDKDLNISTKHFDYFMAQGSSKDFSKYIDVSSYSVDRPNYYSGIEFTTSEPKTVMEHGFTQVNGRKYGELKYVINESGNKAAGEIYEVDLKCQVIPNESLTNINTGDNSYVQYMYLTDKNGTEQQCEPIFTYLIEMVDGTPTGAVVAWDNGSTVSSVTSYFMPSNAYTENVVSLPDGMLGNFFGAEKNEYFRDFSFSNLGLYNMLWRNTVSLMFDENKRRVKHKAFIPLKDLVNLSLADRIIIADKPHIIESIETNYLTGESNLSLIMVQHDDLDMFSSQDPTSEAGLYAYVYKDFDTGIIKNTLINPSTTLSTATGDTTIGGVFERVQSFT